MLSLRNSGLPDAKGTCGDLTSAQQIVPEYTVPFGRRPVVLLAGSPQKRARHETCHPKPRTSHRRPPPAHGPLLVWNRPVAFPPFPRGSTVATILSAPRKAVMPADRRDFPRVQGTARQKRSWSLCE